MNTNVYGWWSWEQCKELGGIKDWWFNDAGELVPVTFTTSDKNYVSTYHDAKYSGRLVKFDWQQILDLKDLTDGSESLIRGSAT